MYILTPSTFAISSFCRVLVCVLLLSSSVTAQKEPLQKPFDPASLRSQFTEVVGKDFEIVKDELKQRSNARGGGTYWLVHVKAKHPGYFALTHRYNYNDSHYSHVEREFNLGIGGAACRRRPPHLGSYSRFCVTDTIIIPIIINNFTEHQFFLTSNTKEQEAAFESQVQGPEAHGIERSQVVTAVADHMRYVGSTSHKMLHRNGGYTLEFHAEFEAQRPGRFNLSLSLDLQSKEAGLLAGLGASGSVPIIIVGLHTPVTLLASRHDVRGYTKGYDGREYVSSTSGDSFMTELLILQPGDRISLKYHTRTHSANYERQERAGDSQEEVPPPLIIKRPFALNTEYNFTEWLLDYLPPDQTPTR